MIAFRFAERDDLKTIQHIAHESWWPAYNAILAKEQIETMLDEFYTEEALQKQVENGHRFILAETEGAAMGFASYSATDDTNVFKVHKLYIIPENQGQGIGKLLINKIAQIAAAEGAGILELCVNRNNPAVYFYERIGFKIVKAVDTPYKKFILDDYILQKPL